MKMLLGTLAGVAATIAAPAMAQSFNSTFEGVPGSPAFNNYSIVDTADGWTGGPLGIELQNHVAGSPAATGGDVFVELDTTANSEMFRTLDAGTYSLSFLYSARPNVGSDSNGIEVLLNGDVIGSFTADGGADTLWNPIALSPFTAAAGSVLSFRAFGTSDGLGGYLDNITATVVTVPEPATWGLMILGFGAVGATLRRRSAKVALA